MRVLSTLTPAVQEAKYRIFRRLKDALDNEEALADGNSKKKWVTVVNTE